MTLVHKGDASRPRVQPRRPHAAIRRCRRSTSREDDKCCGRLWRIRATARERHIESRESCEGDGLRDTRIATRRRKISVAASVGPSACKAVVAWYICSVQRPSDRSAKDGRRMRADHSRTTLQLSSSSLGCLSIAFGPTVVLLVVGDSRGIQPVARVPCGSSPCGARMPAMRSNGTAGNAWTGQNLTAHVLTHSSEIFNVSFDSRRVVTHTSKSQRRRCAFGPPSVPGGRLPGSARRPRRSWTRR